MPKVPFPLNKFKRDTENIPLITTPLLLVFFSLQFSYLAKLVKWIDVWLRGLRHHEQCYKMDVYGEIVLVVRVSVRGMFLLVRVSARGNVSCCSTGVYGGMFLITGGPNLLKQRISLNLHSFFPASYWINEIKKLLIEIKGLYLFMCVFINAYQTTTKKRK